MRGLIAAFCIGLWPAPAVSDTADAACATAWEDIVVFAGSLGEGISQAEVSSQDGNWCALTATADWPFAAGGIDAEFRINRFVDIPPNARSIEVLLADVATIYGTFDVSLVITHQPESGAVRLRNFTARANDGRGIRGNVTATTGTIDRGTDVLAVLPALRISRVDMDFFVTPDLLNEARFDLSDLSRIAVNEALTNVGENQISTRTRNEFLRFAGATPNARGTLSLSVNSAGEGINVWQLAGAIVGQADDTDLFAAVSDAAGDSTVDLTWKPGRM